MKKMFLFMPLVVSSIVLFIVKLILNNNGLEFMSYIYYWFVSINFAYVIIYSLYLFKDNKELKKISIIIELVIFVIVYSTMKICYIGNDVRINEYIVQTKFIIQVQAPKFGYRYVNFFVKGNEEKFCEVEMCEFDSKFMS